VKAVNLSVGLPIVGAVLSTVLGPDLDHAVNSTVSLIVYLAGFFANFVSWIIVISHHGRRGEGRGVVFRGVCEGTAAKPCSVSSRVGKGEIKVIANRNASSHALRMNNLCPNLKSAKKGRASTAAPGSEPGAILEDRVIEIGCRRFRHLLCQSGAGLIFRACLEDKGPRSFRRLCESVTAIPFFALPFRPHTM
jgi:hypothetical protein